MSYGTGNQSLENTCRIEAPDLLASWVARTTGGTTKSRSSPFVMVAHDRCGVSASLENNVFTTLSF